MPIRATKQYIRQISRWRKIVLLMKCGAEPLRAVYVTRFAAQRPCDSPQLLNNEEVIGVNCTGVVNLLTAHSHLISSLSYKLFLSCALAHTCTHKCSNFFSLPPTPSSSPSDILSATLFSRVSRHNTGTWPPSNTVIKWSLVPSPSFPALALLSTQQ